MGSDRGGVRMAAAFCLPRERARLPAPLAQPMLNRKTASSLPTVLAKGHAAAVSPVALQEPLFLGISIFKGCPDPARSIPLRQSRVVLLLTDCWQSGRAGVRQIPGPGPCRDLPPSGTCPGAPSTGEMQGRAGSWESECRLRPHRSGRTLPSSAARCQLGAAALRHGTWGSPRQMLALWQPRGPADSPGQNF